MLPAGFSINELVPPIFLNVTNVPGKIPGVVAANVIVTGAIDVFTKYIEEFKVDNEIDAVIIGIDACMLCDVFNVLVITSL